MPRLNRDTEQVVPRGQRLTKSFLTWRQVLNVDDATKGSPLRMPLKIVVTSRGPSPPRDKLREHNPMESAVSRDGRPG